MGLISSVEHLASVGIRDVDAAWDTIEAPLAQDALAAWTLVRAPLQNALGQFATDAYVAAKQVVSDAVNKAHGFDRPALLHFCEEQIHLVFHHGLKGLVFQCADIGSCFAAPHNPEKLDCRPDAARNRALRQQRGFVNRFGREGQLPFH